MTGASGIIDKPCDLLPGLDEDTDGPDYIGISMLGYHDLEEKMELALVAVNRDGMSNDFRNEIFLFFLTNDKETGEHSMMTKVFENSQLGFIEEKMTKEKLYNLLKIDLPALTIDMLPEDIAEGTLYFSLLNIFQDNKTVQYFNEYCRSSPFPVKIVRRDAFYEIGMAAMTEIAEVMNLLKQNPKDKELKKRETEARKAFTKDYWNYFMEELGEEEDLFIPAKLLGMSALYPDQFEGLDSIIQAMGMERVENTEKELKITRWKSALDFHFASYRSIEKEETALKERFLENSLNENFPQHYVDAVEEAESENAKSVLDKSWKYAAIGSYAFLGGAALASAPFLPELSAPLLGYLAADAMVRAANYKHSDEIRVPGLIGTIRAGLAYICRKIYK